MNPFLRMLVLSLIVMSTMACAPRAQEKQESPRDGVVSLAPNVTEMLFALNLGSRVVGITSACDHPEEVKGIQPVGGFMTPQFEAILATGASVVVGMEGGVPEKEVEKLRAAGKKVILLKDKSVQDVLSSLEVLGNELGVAEGAQTLRRALEKELKPSPIPKLKVGRAPSW